MMALARRLTFEQLDPQGLFVGIVLWPSNFLIHMESGGGLHSSQHYGSIFLQCHSIILANRRYW